MVIIMMNSYYVGGTTEMDNNLWLASISTVIKAEDFDSAYAEACKFGWYTIDDIHLVV